MRIQAQRVRGHRKLQRAAFDRRAAAVLCVFACTPGGWDKPDALQAAVMVTVTNSAELAAAKRLTLRRLIRLSLNPEAIRPGWTVGADAIE
jgi:hypothetical protein